VDIECVNLYRTEFRGHNRKDGRSTSGVHHPLAIVVEFQLRMDHEVGRLMMTGSKRHLGSNDDLVGGCFLWLMELRADYTLVADNYGLIAFFPFFVPVSLLDLLKRESKRRLLFGIPVPDIIHHLRIIIHALGEAFKTVRGFNEGIESGFRQFGCKDRKSVV